MSQTLRISALAAELRSAGRDVLDFSAGQPDFPTPEHVLEAGICAIRDGKTRYTATSGILELREAICDDVLQSHGQRYTTDEVLVSPGAKASLYFALMTLVDEGDEVLVPSPYWVSYPEQVRLCGGKVVTVPCDEAHDFALSVETLAEYTTDRTKVLILNYPSNPTGACFDGPTLKTIAAFCLERGIWIVADEIYSRLIYDGKPFESIVAVDPAVRARTILIDGMSKTYSMTGWRIGYALGPAEIIQAMTRAQSHSTSNATSISQWASVSALREDRSWLSQRVATFQERRDVIVARLRAIDGFHCVQPHGAFYVFPNVSARFTDSIDSGTALARYLLEQAEVAVVPGDAFGSVSHLRLSYADSVERIHEGLDRIERAMADLD